MSRRVSICAGISMLLPCAAVQALRGADAPPPTPAAVRAANPPAESARQGRVSAVDLAGRGLEIDGVWWRVVDGQTRIFQQGRAVGSAALATGQRLSFGTAAGQRVLGVVNVQ